MSIIHSHIDTILIKYLDIDDLRSLYQVNKYYRNLLKNKLTNFIEFYSKVNTIELKWIESDKLFNKAIKFGKLDVCKYIHKKYNANINKYNLSFQLCCSYGNLDVAKWLFSLKNINICHISAFPLACRYGHLNIAKWLYSLGGVDIHISYDSPFRLACANGHLDIAQWLLSLGNVDVRANSDYAFRWSRQNAHNVAQWLCSIELRYRIQIIDNEIRYIID